MIDKDRDSLVSLIIPAYNMERYIGECLDSLIAQTYKNIEIIVVIDGATDHSLEIAQEYAKKDSRIRILHQKNTGVGPAQNNGMEIAHGEYLTFVGADDWLEPDMIERLYGAIVDGYDLALSGTIFNYFDGDHPLSTRTLAPVCAEELREADAVHAAYLRLFRDELVCGPTRKLYRTSIIKQHKLNFPALKRSQDIVFNYQYYDCVRTIRIIPYAGYHYRIFPGNYFSKIQEDYVTTVDLILNDVRQLHKKWQITPAPGEFENTFLYMYTSCMESNILSGKNITALLDNPQLRQTYAAATLRRPDILLLKIGVKHRWQWLITISIRAKVLFKRLMRR